MACNVDSVVCCPLDIAGQGSLPGVSAAPLPLESMEMASPQITQNNGVGPINDSIMSICLQSSSESHSLNLSQFCKPSVEQSSANIYNNDESWSSSDHDTFIQSLKYAMSVSVLLKRLEDQPHFEELNTSATSENSDDWASSRKKSRGSFACNEPGCGKIFKRPDRLQQHARIHTGARPYVCDVAECGRSYTRSQHLARHKAVSHSSPAEKKEQATTVRCRECNKDYSSVYSLRKHLAQFHTRRKHSCAECGLLFLKQQHLSVHMQSHSHQLAFRCEFPGCKKAFAVPSKLKRHSQMHQAGRYRCTRDDNCSQTFDRYLDLRQHLAAEHPYTCPVCGVQFTQLGRYNRHRVTHEDMRLTYHCTKAGCGRCYYSLRALTSHVRDKHDGETLPHDCPVCGRVFSSKQKLVQHLKMHHWDYARRSCASPGVARKKRWDQGRSRTDYHRLLSGHHTPDGKALLRRAKSQSPTSEYRQKKPDYAFGTRQQLEGSVLARELSLRASNDVKDAHEKSVKSNNRDVDAKDLLNSLHRSREFHSDKQVNMVVEGEKIGDVFVSGEGAEKEGRGMICQAKLSDEMAKLFDTCHLKEN